MSENTGQPEKKRGAKPGVESFDVRSSTQPIRDTAELDYSTSERDSESAGRKLELLVVRGRELGKKVPVPAVGIMIGRDPSCDLSIGSAEDGTSRYHARIFNEDGRLVIRDLNSRNGLLVNGRQCRESVLAPGDILQIGETVFNVVPEAPRTVQCDSCGFANRPGAEFCEACRESLLDTVCGSEPALTHDSDAAGLHALQVGQNFKGYHIDDVLGHGAMGVVFKATHLQLRRQVALKILPPTHLKANLIRRFIREAQALARLDHPYIIAVHDMFKAGEYFCIVMSFGEGGTLKKHVAENGPLGEMRAASVAHQAALGLWAAAQEGIVHRDIKPDNLLLTRGGRVKIADFGLARFEKSISISAIGSIMGTAAYMSPEQWLDCRSSDHRSDLYSLGCTLFEFLSGRPPFQGPSIVNFMEQHRSLAAPRLRDLPGCECITPEMDRILARLLEKDPDKRFQSGHELAASLEPLTGGEMDDGNRSGITPVTFAIENLTPEDLGAAGESSDEAFDLGEPGERTRRVLSQEHVPTGTEVSALSAPSERNLVLYGIGLGILGLAALFFIWKLAIG